ncbi:Cysteine protease [Aphelenchoides bicaudatus]|nr:Cysteine protease [Aphelenchoides bicaudatus]
MLNKVQESSQSILWFTYRTNFPAIGGDGPTTDQGWGCMLRCGQMMLAHALKVVHLGRSWQWTHGIKDPDYRRLLRMFQDKRSSLFSLQQIAMMGKNEGKKLCEWFGPNTVAQCLKKLVIYDGWSQLAVHVAMDNLLIASDVKLLAGTSWSDVSEPNDEKRPKIDEIEQDKTWRPVLIIIPLRLGLSAINREYLKPVQEFFKLPQCCGILGGRPNHAVFFTGFSAEELYYLDPHTAQPTVDLDKNQVTTPPVKLDAPKTEEINSPEKEDTVLVEENGQESNDINGKASDIAWPSDELETSQINAKVDENQKEDDKQELFDEMQESTNQLQQSDSKSSIDEDNFSDDTFHCQDLLHMHFDSLDPSLALGFICKCEDDFDDLVEKLKEKVLTASKPALFELIDVRPKNWPAYVPYTRVVSTSGDATDKDYEDFADPQFDSGDEFEILQ